MSARTDEWTTMQAALAFGFMDADETERVTYWAAEEIESLRSQLAGAVEKRAKWTRAFNRLEKAVTNHVAGCIDSDDLAHAHRAVMRDLGPGAQS
jgi:hypothetical protein